MPFASAIIVSMKAHPMARIKRRLVICVDNTDCEVSLEGRKIYVALPDTVAKHHRYVRVVDESGEDYLFPAKYFVGVDLPPAARRAVLRTVDRSH